MASFSRDNFIFKGRIFIVKDRIFIFCWRNGFVSASITVARPCLGEQGGAPYQHNNQSIRDLIRDLIRDVPLQLKL